MKKRAMGKRKERGRVEDQRGGDGGRERRKISALYRRDQG